MFSVDEAVFFAPSPPLSMGGRSKSKIAHTHFVAVGGGDFSSERKCGIFRAFCTHKRSYYDNLHYIVI